MASTTLQTIFHPYHSFPLKIRFQFAFKRLLARSNDWRLDQLSLSKMKVATPLKTLTSSILIPFQVAFWNMNNCEVLLNSLQLSIQSLLTHVSISWNKLRTCSISPELEKESITKEFMTLGEINMVMDQLGFQNCCSHDSKIDVLSVFDDEEPSLGEVKVAFDVFDVNSDGFIDEFELQKMLCKFGAQPDEPKLEQCRNMIKGFDVNGDGVIDFDEFVKLLETCYF